MARFDPPAVPKPAFWPELVLPRPPDDAAWLALTIRMEAGAERWEGKLAVAYVIVGRARRTKASIVDTVLKAWQFSAWNTEEPTRKLLDTIPPELWAECYFAGLAALGGFLPDPSRGASHYLNPVATAKARRAKGWSPYPDWATDPADKERLDERRITAWIDNHVFMAVD
ncbi:MAG TPA: cell wall hydrolase [Thermodesulfobacteriota bacterium]